MASYLGGLVAAYELGIVDKGEMDRRMFTLLKTLNSIVLFRGELPNKVYNTKTAEKVNYANKPGEIGFSALDIGRLLIWMKIIKERYPEHSNGIDRAVMRWSFCNVVKDGIMWGSYVDKQSNKTKYIQEGRLGYEEYAAKGYELWGFDTSLASLAEPYDLIPLFGIEIPYDTRDPRVLRAHNYVVAESFVLDGIELNWDKPEDRLDNDSYHSNPWIAETAQSIYAVQERRFRATGVITARTEHQLDKAPYFVYDTIYTDGYAWNTITESGKYVPEFAAVAAKGAIGLWALWETPYTDLLFRVVQGLQHPEKGIYEGLYENGKGEIAQFTANNNGIILETLLYKEQGKLLKFGNNVSMWDRVVQDPFKSRSKCLPTDTSNFAQSGDN